MALVLTREQADQIVVALELKLSSLKRGQKSATPSFAAVYENDIAVYNRLVDLVRSGVDANAKADAKR